MKRHRQFYNDYISLPIRLNDKWESMGDSFLSKEFPDIIILWGDDNPIENKYQNENETPTDNLSLSLDENENNTDENNLLPFATHKLILSRRIPYIRTLLNIPRFIESTNNNIRIIIPLKSIGLPSIDWSDFIYSIYENALPNYVIGYSNDQVKEIKDIQTIGKIMTYFFTINFLEINKDENSFIGNRLSLYNIFNINTLKNFWKAIIESNNICSTKISLDDSHGPISINYHWITELFPNKDSIDFLNKSLTESIYEGCHPDLLSSLKHYGRNLYEKWYGPQERWSPSYSPMEPPSGYIPSPPPEDLYYYYTDAQPPSPPSGDEIKRLIDLETDRLMINKTADHPEGNTLLYTPYFGDDAYYNRFLDNDRDIDTTNSLAISMEDVLANIPNLPDIVLDEKINQLLKQYHKNPQIIFPLEDYKIMSEYEQKKLNRERENKEYGETKRDVESKSLPRSIDIDRNRFIDTSLLLGPVKYYPPSPRYSRGEGNFNNYESDIDPESVPAPNYSPTPSTYRPTSPVYRY